MERDASYPDCNGPMEVNSRNSNASEICNYRHGLSTIIDRNSGKRVFGEIVTGGIKSRMALFGVTYRMN